MSLEAKIELLTAAVVELTRVMQLKPNPVTASLDSIVHELASAPVTTLPPANEDEAKTQIDAEKAGNVKSNPTTDTSPPSSNESRTVTYDDVKNVTIAVSKIGKAKAVAGLARFGVQTAKSLNEGQWLDYVVYMERVAKGEVDPESSHE